MNLRLLTVLIAALPIAAVAQITSNWGVNLRQDPITDEVVGGALLFGTNQSRLLFACNGLLEKTLSVQFLPRRFLGSTDNIVLLRFDKDRPMPATVWTYTSTGAYTTDPAFVEAFAARVGSEPLTITVQALNYEDQPVDAVFASLDGRSAINKVRQACGKQPL